MTDNDNELWRTLGRIEGKLDDALASVANHGPRISILEAFKERSLGYGAGILGVAAAVSWVVSLISR